MHVNTVGPLMDCYQHQARVNVEKLHRNAAVHFTTFFAHKIESSVTTDVPPASHFLMAHRQMYHILAQTTNQPRLPSSMYSEFATVVNPVCSHPSQLLRKQEQESRYLGQRNLVSTLCSAN